MNEQIFKRLGRTSNERLSSAIDDVATENYVKQDCAGAVYDSAFF
jgi:hypothetical protein